MITTPNAGKPEPSTVILSEAKNPFLLHCGDPSLALSMATYRIGR
ncbi:MAG: hypothetical protein ACUVRT_09320 [Armatimonadota bacterium]